MIVHEVDEKNINIVKTLINDGHLTEARYLLKYFCEIDYYESRNGRPDYPYHQDYWDKIYKYFGWENEIDF